jgi:hypothetical protein
LLHFGRKFSARLCEHAVVIDTGVSSGQVPVVRAPRWTLTDHRRAQLETALIVVGWLLLFFLLPHQLRNDDKVRLNDIEQLLRHGHLTASKYSLVMPLISAPMIIIGNLTGSTDAWALHFNTVVVGLGVLIAYRLLRGRVDPRMFRLCVLVLLFASFLTGRLRDYDVEVTSATLIALGIICLATNQRVVAGWTAIVFAVVNTPAAIVALVLISAVQAVRTRQLRQLLPVVAAAALIMLEAWIRRGSPFDSGYGKQSLTNTFALGLFEVIFSFGRGIIFYMPGLLLWLNSRVRRQLPGRGAVALMMVFVVGLVLVYAKWWAWYGGITWGPRFFTFAAIPASILIASRVWRAGESVAADALALGVLALSAWVAFTSVIADLTTVLGYCIEKKFEHLYACVYYPANSSLYQPVTDFPRLAAGTVVVVVFMGLVFCYLAAPLVVSLARAVWPRRSWAAGWRV